MIQGISRERGAAMPKLRNALHSVLDARDSVLDAHDWVLNGQDTVLDAHDWVLDAHDAGLETFRAVGELEFLEGPIYLRRERMMRPATPTKSARLIGSACSSRASVTRSLDNVARTSATSDTNIEPTLTSHRF